MKTNQELQAEKEALNNALVNCAFKVGDAVTEPIWEGYDWKIKEFLMSRGKLRAVLQAVISPLKPRYDFFKGEYVIEDRLARCSAWVADLKPALN